MTKMIAKISFLTLAVFAADGARAELLHRWVFDGAHRNGQTFSPETGGTAFEVSGPVYLTAENGPESLFVNKEETMALGAGGAGTGPTEAITAEAWINIEHTVEWGGVIGVLPAEADSNQGWVLGFRQSSFSFGISSEGAGRMTHLRAANSLEWGAWHHIAGTYDGAMQRVYVDGRLMNESDVHSGPIVIPEDARFRLGSFVKDGRAFRWRGMIREVAVHARALTPGEIKAKYEAEKEQFPQKADLKIANQVERLGRDRIAISWETEIPCKTAVLFGDGFPLTQRVETPDPVTRHRVTVNGVEGQKMYYYRILVADEDGNERATRLFEFDSTFDYTPEPLNISENPYPEDEYTAHYERLAQTIVDETGVTQGYCLVLGSEDGRLAFELAKRTDLQIVGVDDNADRIRAAREKLDRAGVYGVRVSIHNASLGELPYPDYFANLIVSDRMFKTGEIPTPAAEMYRVLRPAGGAAYLGQPDGAFQTLTRGKLDEWLSMASIPERMIRRADGIWTFIRREPLPGAGAWNHQYGDAGHTSSSKDEYPELPITVLWFGRPGPRPMVDRGTRSPAPLSINGRMFVQGDRRLFGIDAYNGTILWTREIPDLRRANIPRDSSNMVASGEKLFAAVNDSCWVIDAQTGGREDAFFLPGPYADTHDWGYLSYLDGSLIGSCVKKGGIYIGADGEWYDASNEESFKVVSDALFNYNAKTGGTNWVYRNDSAIINPTISAGGGKVFFAECRNPEVVKTTAGRVANQRLSDTYLVALDLATGDPLWEREVDLNEGRWVLYLTYADDTLVATSTTDQYHVYAFDAKSGDPLWNQSYPWYKDHHGGAMQHPVVVGSTLYAEPKVFNLRTGEDMGITMPERNKCGTLSASAHSLFYRDYWHAMWDLEKDERIDWKGMRPGCWLNMIPANGVILAPEASAGCYCSQPIQTSIAFTPAGERR